MTDEAISEMKFGRGDSDRELCVQASPDGEVLIGAQTEVYHLGYKLTLGQAIQLRDFLNRHIDELALKQTGSLAVRSSDDPNQLAAVEETAADPGCGCRFRPQAGPTEAVCGEQSRHGYQPVLCPECNTRPTGDE